jgi:hypothetical protein
VRFLLTFVLLMASSIVTFVQRFRERRARLPRIIKAVQDDRLPPPPPGVSLLALRGELVRTDVRSDEIYPLASAAESIPGDLNITEFGLTLVDGERLLVQIPNERVVEALIVRAETESLLRIDWIRGRYLLSSTFRLEGGIRSAEQVRREMHLRAGQARPIRR